MSRQRTLLFGLPRAAGVAAAGTLLLGLGGLFACSTYPTYKDLPTDCTAENGYELYDQDTTPTDPTLTPLDYSSFGHWFSAADYTPDGGVAVSYGDAASNYVDFAQENPVDLSQQDGPVCGHTAAIVLRASHNNDWGCLFGPWDFGKDNPENASAWEGIAFWARAPGDTSKGITLSLSDDNSQSGASGTYCRNYVADGGISTQTSAGPNGINPSTGTPLSGSSTTRAPYPDECGNGYTVEMQVTTDWRFYKVPFSDFKQASSPNRVPNSVFDAGSMPGNGLLTSRLRNFVVRMPRAAVVELWLTKLAFYRKNTHADAGAGVAQIDAARIDGARMDGAQIDAAQIDAVRIDAAQIDGTQIDEAQIDGTQIGEAQVDGAQIDLPQI